MAGSSGTKKKTSPFWWIMLGVLIAGVLGAGAWGAVTLLAQKTVDVPSVVGRPAAAARTTLKAAGLAVKVEEVFDAKVPAGQVISQDPEAGINVKAGTAVLVTVSKGAQYISVPDLKGMTRENAVAQLKSIGLTVGDVTGEYNSKMAGDLVMRQNPKPGAKLLKGESVDMVVSKGTHTVEVPSVVGKTVAVARRMLGDAGLNADVTERSSTSEPAGTVLSQNPTAGQAISIGGTVSITVSSGTPLVKMPDVRKMGAVAARNKLEALGLVVQADYVPDVSTKVVKQSPNPSARLQAGSTVKIWIGDGSRP